MPAEVVLGEDLKNCAILLRSVPYCNGSMTPMLLRVSTEGMNISAMNSVRSLELTLSQVRDSSAGKLLRHLVLPIIKLLSDGRHLAVSMASVVADALFSRGSCPNNMTVGEERTRRANQQLWTQCFGIIISEARASWNSLIEDCVDISTTLEGAAEGVLRTRVAPSILSPLRDVVVAYLRSPFGVPITSDEVLCCVPGMDVSASVLVDDMTFVITCSRASKSRGTHTALFLAGASKEDDDDDDRDADPFINIQALADCCCSLGVTVVYTDAALDDRTGDAFGITIVRIDSMKEVQGTLPVVNLAHPTFTKDHSVNIESVKVLTSHVCLVEVRSPRPSKHVRMLIGCPAKHNSEVWSERREAVLSAVRVCQHSTRCVERRAGLIRLLSHLRKQPALQSKDAVFVVDLIQCFAESAALPAFDAFEADYVVVEAFCAALRILMTLIRIDCIVV